MKHSFFKYYLQTSYRFHNRHHPIQYLKNFREDNYWKKINFVSDDNCLPFERYLFELVCCIQDCHNISGEIDYNMQ